ncbi:MAG TPA: methyltransferase domain-containing protein [Methylomirabilota bacterium]|jgi:ubiquinone/menaquinone biosynthesis C-methylase UbiE|nr:methyltransferase domain-containing protein [Methylomirabilota bacterium]
MTNWRRTVQGFSETAENYADTMAPSLRTMAVSVVQRAELRAGDRILDAGTGTGIGAAAALTAGREVVGVDAAAGMLAIARREVPGARFVEADYSKLPFPAGSFDVVMSVHALHFAVDPVAVLAEWRRVTTAGGRLSLSVPGPRTALSYRLFDPIYRRHGLLRRIEVPTRAKLLSRARAAGWRSVTVVADPTTTIRLAGPDSFERWMKTGSRSVASRALSDEQFAALSSDLLAATPVGPDGRLHIPFGTLYLTARNP